MTGSREDRRTSAGRPSYPTEACSWCGSVLPDRGPRQTTVPNRFLPGCYSVHEDRERRWRAFRTGALTVLGIMVLIGLATRLIQWPCLSNKRRVFDGRWTSGPLLSPFNKIPLSLSVEYKFLDLILKAWLRFWSVPKRRPDLVWSRSKHTINSEFCRDTGPQNSGKTLGRCFVLFLNGEEGRSRWVLIRKNRNKSHEPRQSNRPLFYKREGRGISWDTGSLNYGKHRGSQNSGCRHRPRLKGGKEITGEIPAQ